MDDTDTVPASSRRTAAQKVAQLELMLGQIANYCPVKLEQGEHPEDLYQRLMAFVEDNLLTASGGIKHHEESPTEDEDISPTLENLIVLLWLKLTHSELPRLVKQ